MSKIDIIEYCGDCSHRYYNGNKMECDLTNKDIHESKQIPDWCPLPEDEEE